MATTTYNAKSIITDTGLAIMRRRPTQYLPNTEHEGIGHLIVELQDNSFDEVTMMGPAGRVDVMLCKDPKRKTFQVVVIDNGRGIPLGALHAAYTEPHTSGKYDTNSYTYSSGLFGVGGKVAAGLSQRFRAVSFRPTEGTGSIFITKGVHGPTADLTQDKVKDSGMSVVLEPDPDIFTGIDTYADIGWGGLLERIHKYTFFHTSHIRFLLSDVPVPEDVWLTSNTKAVEILKDHMQTGNVLFDSLEFNRDAWLRKYLGVNRPFTWSHTFKREADKESSTAFDIRMHYSRTEPGYSRFGMINSVPIDSANSNHLSEVVKAVSNRIGQMIPSKEVRKFFEETYKIPLYLAVEVKYEGAEFTGTTKHSFISAEFRAEYGDYLDAHFKTPEGRQAIGELYDLIGQDIQDKYIASITGQVEVKNRNRLFQDLRYPEKFTDCTTKDRSRAELFIVEGDSAGGGIKANRDGETMGLYTIRGKPFNAIKAAESPEAVPIEMQKDFIYRDLIRILGLDPQKPDLNSMYFSRIFLLTDADQTKLVNVLPSNGKHPGGIGAY